LETIFNLKQGEKAIIQSFKSEQLSLKFLEMGCTPGSVVMMKYKAPFGSPVCIKIKNYDLGLRKSEAESIIVSKLPHD
jgi:ferrous iron transport protein A